MDLQLTKQNLAQFDGLLDNAQFLTAVQTLQSAYTYLNQVVKLSESDEYCNAVQHSAAVSFAEDKLEPYFHKLNKRLEAIKNDTTPFQGFETLNDVLTHKDVLDNVPLAFFFVVTPKLAQEIDRYFKNQNKNGNSEYYTICSIIRKSNLSLRHVYVLGGLDLLLQTAEKLDMEVTGVYRDYDSQCGLDVAFKVLKACFDVKSAKTFKANMINRIVSSVMYNESNIAKLLSFEELSWLFDDLLDYAKEKNVVHFVPPFELGLKAQRATSQTELLTAIKDYITANVLTCGIEYDLREIQRIDTVTRNWIRAIKFIHILITPSSHYSLDLFCKAFDDVVLPKLNAAMQNVFSDGTDLGRVTRVFTQMMIDIDRNETNGNHYRVGFAPLFNFAVDLAGKILDYTQSKVGSPLSSINEEYILAHKDELVAFFTSTWVDIDDLEKVKAIADKLNPSNILPFNSFISFMKLVNQLIRNDIDYARKVERDKPSQREIEQELDNKQRKEKQKAFAKIKKDLLADLGLK